MSNKPTTDPIEPKQHNSRKQQQILRPPTNSLHTEFSNYSTATVHHHKPSPLRLVVPATYPNLPRDNKRGDDVHLKNTLPEQKLKPPTVSIRVKSFRLTQYFRMIPSLQMTSLLKIKEKHSSSSFVLLQSSICQE